MGRPNFWKLLSLIDRVSRSGKLMVGRSLAVRVFVAAISSVQSQSADLKPETGKEKYTCSGRASVSGYPVWCGRYPADTWAIGYVSMFHLFRLGHGNCSNADKAYAQSLVSEIQRSDLIALYLLVENRAAYSRCSSSTNLDENCERIGVPAKLKQNEALELKLACADETCGQTVGDVWRVVNYSAPIGSGLHLDFPENCFDASPAECFTTPKIRATKDIYFEADQALGFGTIFLFAGPDLPFPRSAPLGGSPNSDGSVTIVTALSYQSMVSNSSRCREEAVADAEGTTRLKFLMPPPPSPPVAVPPGQPAPPNHPPALVLDKDPHLHFAHGGRADFRGRHGRLFNFFSAPNIAVNLRIENATFELHRSDGSTLVVDGSFVTEMHLTARVGPTKRVWANFSFWASELTENNWGYKVINGSCHGRRVRIGKGKSKRCEELTVAVQMSHATFAAGNWSFSVQGRPTFDLIAGPEHRLDIGAGVKGDYAERFQPHGIFGQSFSSTGPLYGKVDNYPHSGHFVTSAQARGS